MKSTGSTQGHHTCINAFIAAKSIIRKNNLRKQGYPTFNSTLIAAKYNMRAKNSKISQESKIKSFDCEESLSG